MNIGIIGNGVIGSMLRRRLLASGHRVIVVATSNSSISINRFSSAGRLPVASNSVLHLSDVVFISLPLWQISTLPRNLFAKANNDLAIVDMSDFYLVNVSVRYTAWTTLSMPTIWLQRNSTDLCCVFSITSVGGIFSTRMIWASAPSALRYRSRETTPFTNSE